MGVSCRGPNSLSVSDALQRALGQNMPQAQDNKDRTLTRARPDWGPLGCVGSLWNPIWPWNRSPGECGAVLRSILKMLRNAPRDTDSKSYGQFPIYLGLRVYGHGPCLHSIHVEEHNFGFGGHRHACSPCQGRNVRAPRSGLRPRKTMHRAV